MPLAVERGMLALICRRRPRACVHSVYIPVPKVVDARGSYVIGSGNEGRHYTQNMSSQTLLVLLVSSTVY